MWKPVHLMLAMAVAGLPSIAQAAPPEPEQPFERRLTLCRPGPDETSPSPHIRPTRTAVCPYDQKEMYRRLEEAISRTGSPLSAIRAQSLFGLPGMTTDYDSRREASYTMVVSGQGGWKLQLRVRESAFPLDATLAPAFEPGERAQRLFALDELDVRYDINIILPDGNNTPDQCMTAADAAKIALATGWTDDTDRASIIVTDPRSPRYVTNNKRAFYMNIRQAARLPTEAEMKAQCITRISFMQLPIREHEGG